ncbi:MAG: GPGG-motif small membrane protein [Acidimicrobiales bacterium]
MAVIIAIIGVVQLIQGQILFGILLLIAAAAVGPGGYSVFRSRA